MMDQKPPFAQVHVLPPRVRRLLRQPQLRRQPFKALARRLHWHLRWAFSGEPWLVMTSGGFRLRVPNSGSAALLYYQGASEPESLDFLRRFLAPGMTVLDVGAHFGEYTVLAATLTGSSGTVHAFEPQPGLFRLLQENVQANGATNVVLNPSAAADRSGKVVFWERFELASSSLAGNNIAGREVRRVYEVPCWALDDYCEHYAVLPRLIKVDVEGAEPLVLRGARGLCSLPPGQAPVWLIEYSPVACARIGQRAEEIPRLLGECGYRCFALDAQGYPIAVEARLRAADLTINLVALKGDSW